MMKISYPYIPEGREILYVSAENPFMFEAKRFCLENSTDDKQLTGAVIVQNGVIISKGANQTKLKGKFLKRLHEKGWCVRKILHVKTGEKYWLCPGCSGYETHAEARAIFDAHKQQKSTQGADLYLWGHWWCCKPCWDKMVGAGIKNAYLLENSEALFNRSNPNNMLGREKWKN